jgi:hypothetical protein
LLVEEEKNYSAVKKKEGRKRGRNKKITPVAKKK